MAGQGHGKSEPGMARRNMMRLAGVAAASIPVALHAAPASAEMTIQSAELQAAIDATPTGGVLQLDSGTTYAVTSTLVVNRAMTIMAAGRATLTMASGTGPIFTITGSRVRLSGLDLNCSGSGIAVSPASRVYTMMFDRLVITGPGSGVAGRTGLNLDSVSSSSITDVTVSGFETGFRTGSAIYGGCVYNTFNNVTASSCGVGFKIQSTGSNEHRFLACRANACTVRGFEIIDSNHNLIDNCAIEACAVGVYIESTTVALSDFNTISQTRFEGNTTAWVVNSTRVRMTKIIANAPVGTYAYTDNGDRTEVIGGDPAHFQSAQSSSTGSWRFTRISNGGTELPAMVVADTASTMGTPVTVQVETARWNGFFLRGRFSDNRTFDVRADGRGYFGAGLAVGNSAAATTPGTVVRRIEIFDAAGTSLGFIPVYNQIT